MPIIDSFLGELDHESRNRMRMLERVPDENPELKSPFTLKRGPQVVFTIPKAGVIRAILLNHTVHHRAQLGVYLRLLDVPVPAMYGTSADEA